MKFLFLATMLALCSCATGVYDPIEEQEQEEVYVAPPQRPAPPVSEPSEPVKTPQCRIDAYWVGNCYIVKIYCKDQPTRTEVACGPSRPLWPWEVDPYPPPYDNRK